MDVTDKIIVSLLVLLLLGMTLVNKIDIDVITERVEHIEQILEK